MLDTLRAYPKLTRVAHLKLAVLLSGSGRTLQNFIDLIARGELDAEIVGVVSSKPGVRGITRAEEAGIPVAVVARRETRDVDAYSAKVTEAVRDFGPVDLVVLAGFLSLWRPPAELAGRVMNIHPALLPSFGGKGYYGDRVHRAVIDAGVRWSGCTVHFVDDRYDSGPIILQRVVPVHFDDDPSALADRVFAEELSAYPEAIRLFADGRLRIDGRRVEVRAEPSDPSA